MAADPELEGKVQVAIRQERLEVGASLAEHRQPYIRHLFVASGQLKVSNLVTGEEQLVAELVREAALDGVRDELPHSIAVTVDEMTLRDPEDPDSLLDIYAGLYVERPSQKAIVLGRGGERLRRVGATARAQIERLLGTKVYLVLHVRVAKEWQRDPKQLRKLGF